MATALLITIIALFMIFVAAGVYAVKNRQIWIAHGITAAMNAVINKSGLPSPEKSQIKVEIDISDEFKKTVEDALGGSLSWQPSQRTGSGGRSGDPAKLPQPKYMVS